MIESDTEIVKLSQEINAAAHQLKRVEDLESDLNKGVHRFELRFSFEDESAKSHQFSLTDADGSEIFRLAIDHLRTKYHDLLDASKAACYAEIDKQRQTFPQP